MQADALRAAIKEAIFLMGRQKAVFPLSAPKVEHAQLFALGGA